MDSGEKKPKKYNLDSIHSRRTVDPQPKAREELPPRQSATAGLPSPQQRHRRRHACVRGRSAGPRRWRRRQEYLHRPHIAPDPQRLRATAHTAIPAPPPGRSIPRLRDSDLESGGHDERGTIADFLKMMNPMDIEPLS